MAERDGNRIARPVAYNARWEGPFEAYARRFAADNHWRVRHMWPDYEDVVGECKVVFCRCLQRYTNRVTNGAWFMSLFKRALANDFNSFAIRNAKQAKGLEEYTEAMRNDNTAHEHSLGPLAAQLSKASPGLQEILHKLATAPQPLLDILIPDNPKDISPQALSRSWSRLARLKNLREDLILELRDLLG